MATWIVHLRVAESLLGTIDELDRCQFLIGSLAPDSGLPDEKWQRFEPPPEVTHFGRIGRSKREMERRQLIKRKVLARAVLESITDDAM